MEKEENTRKPSEKRSLSDSLEDQEPRRGILDDCVRDWRMLKIKKPADENEAVYRPQIVTTDGPVPRTVIVYEDSGKIVIMDLYTGLK